MPPRSHYGWVDPNNPEAAGVCDRGGEVRRRSELQKEMIWAGNRLVWNGMLCCARHLDRPNPQSSTLVLRPDPIPIFDPRILLDSPYIYPTTIGILTEDGDFIMDEQNAYLVT